MLREIVFRVAGLYWKINKDCFSFRFEEDCISITKEYKGTTCENVR